MTTSHRGRDIRIGVAVDRFGGWHEGILNKLSTLGEKAHWLRCELVDLDGHDWAALAQDHDVIVWKSSVMGPEAAGHFKEKVYFLERHLQKRVIPNFSTIWHFESKVAQSYLFDLEQVSTPKTFVSFEREDALTALESWTTPLVFKGSAGAGSTQVRLVRTRESARTIINQTFAHQVWSEWKRQGRTAGKSLFKWVSAAREGWLTEKVKDHFLGREAFRPVYWQEFISDNDADLRITVIGARYAVGFWRRNRAGDFRASGSGRIDYEKPVPRAAVEYCIELSRRLDFDSMAYDLLFKGEKFVVGEMSYGYVAGAVAQAPGYFEARGEGGLAYHSGGRWPQEFWAELAFAEARRLSERTPAAVGGMK